MSGNLETRGRMNSWQLLLTDNGSFSTWTIPFAAVRGEEVCWTGVNLEEYEWSAPR